MAGGAVRWAGAGGLGTSLAGWHAHGPPTPGVHCSRGAAKHFAWCMVHVSLLHCLCVGVWVQGRLPGAAGQAPG